MKVCVKCNQEKASMYFSKHCSTLDGLRNSCKECNELYKKQYRKVHSEKIKHYNELNKERTKQWRKKNSVKLKEAARIYYDNNRDKIRSSKREYTRNRRNFSPLFKFSENVRKLIGNSFKFSKGQKKGKKTETMLGCTIPELREHLAKQFKDGMTFENHGQWHIDHRIPLASAKTQEEVEKLCHYTNLQPLWASDNIRKGNKT